MSSPLNTYKGMLSRSEVLFDHQELIRAIKGNAEEISHILADQDPIIITVMNGGMRYAAELIHHFTFPCRLDYMHATRYEGKTSGGKLHWQKTPQLDLKNETVLLVDDILDGGITLQALVDFCKTHNAKNIFTSVMIDKPSGRIPGGLPEAHFNALVMEDDHFIVGFGLDYKHGYGREINDIITVAPEDM